MVRRDGVPLPWRAAMVLFLALALTLGSLPGVSLAAPMERPLADNYVYYTVRPGDVLSRIALHYGVSAQTLMQINGITNPNHIYVGQVLKIPKAGTSCAFYHQVTAGQTLSGIAQYYGVSLYALANANNVSHTSYVYTGQSLCIPGTGGPVYVPPQPDYGQGQYYTVRAGDTLSGIAYRFGTSVGAIMNANNIAHPNHIWAGQRLFIPGRYTPPPAPQPPMYPPPAPAPQPTPVPPPPAFTWTGLYYNNIDFGGSPVLIRQDSVIDFNWGFGSPAQALGNDMFSVIWTASPHFNEGTYRFYATSDDGVRIYVDDKLVVDGWSIHPGQGYFGDIYLGAGHHSVRVEYFEHSEVALIKVHWTRL